MATWQVVAYEIQFSLMAYFNNQHNASASNIDTASSNFIASASAVLTVVCPPCLHASLLVSHWVPTGHRSLYDLWSFALVRTKPTSEHTQIARKA